MNEPSKHTPKALTITQQIQDPAFLSKLAAALPRHLTKERYARLILTAISQNPRLRDCDQASVMSAVVQAAQLGIEIDGRHGHLVPFRNDGRLEAKFIPDWKGLVQLVLRSGLVKSIHLDVVCDNDAFEYDRGELRSHRINFREDRGAAYAAYSLVRMNDGSESVCIMGRHEIEAIRARTKKGEKQSPWDTDWSEMAKKTVFKRHTKSLAISAEFRDAEVLEETEVEPVDVTPRTPVERAGFERPQAALPASDPFPPEEGDLAPQPGVDGGVEAAPATIGAEPVASTPTKPARSKPAATKHPVEAFVTRAGFTLEEASAALVHEQFVEVPIRAWAEIPEPVVTQLCNSQVGFLTMLGQRRHEGTKP